MKQVFNSVLLNNLKDLCFSEINLRMPFVEGEVPAFWWDVEADRCILIGVFKHGKTHHRGSSQNNAFWSIFAHMHVVQANFYPNPQRP